ncbi:Nif3-like dinuclear metal center hexameric protein [candidate division KSB1 bacterium]|nr:Nif3-like dinuclear metal center hexameric protein [candidate division KSB1 bacterium]
MAAITTKDLTNYLDQYLRVKEIRESAINGLQVQGKEKINKIGFAVDACLESFAAAKEAGVDMLIVHHGLFWGREQALIGSHFYRIKALLKEEINLYAAHIPLDAHPEVGNNARLAALLELEIDMYFGDYGGTPVAVLGHSSDKLTAAQLHNKLKKAIGDHVRLDAFGPEIIRHVGICSGAGASLIPEAKSIGADAFITGEPRQGFYHFSQEEGMHIFYGRHYNTETIGLKALAEHLEELFEIETLFFDVPTNI